MIGLHWITVGNVSEKAVQSIKQAGGKVVHMQVKGDIPTVFLVGIPCKFSSGHSNNVQIEGWNELFITVPTHGLSLSISSQLSKKSLHISQVPIHKTSLMLINERVKA